ncbi:MAG: hypothetical protein V3U88_02940 [Methylococcales bacterium]
MKQAILVRCILAPYLLIWCSVIQASVVDHPFFRMLGVVIVWGADDWQENGGNAPIVSDFVLMNSASGTAGNDIIAGDVYTVLQNSLLPSRGSAANNAGNEMLIRRTGPSGARQLMSDNNNDSYLDAGDSFNRFELQNNTNVRIRGRSMNHSFYVASNVAFNIFAQVQNLQTSGDFTGLGWGNIRWRMGINRTGNDGLAYGSNAQNPSSGGIGIINGNGNTRLDTMTTPLKVFEGGRRTAATPGSIAQQSVRFTAKYALRRNTSGNGSYDLSMGKGHIETDVTYMIYVP